MNSIIKKFDENDKVFAKEAVLEAQAKKGEINRELLSVVSDFYHNLDKYSEKGMPISVIYSIMLLAEFKDQKLFSLLIKICSKDFKETNGYVMDECLNDQLHRIIISVFDGNFKALNDIIENKKINEEIRSSLLRCYIYFYDQKMISKNDLQKYLKKLIKLYNYDDDYIYDVIMEIIINTHLFDLIDEVKIMFDMNVIDPMIRGGYTEFIDDIFDYEDDLDKFAPISDTIKEMSWWYCFAEDDKMFDEEKFKDEFSNLVKTEMNKIISYEKVGRNDPCPCGSGKKYKKCCLIKKEKPLPYQEYINESLKKYPKRKTRDDIIDIYDFFSEEYVEIDKMLYQVFKHRSIPMFVERDYDTEDKNDLIKLEEAFEKIKAAIEKNNFKTTTDYDKIVSIHYSILIFVENYINLLQKFIEKENYKKEEYLKKLEDLLKCFYTNFDLNNEDEYIFFKGLQTIFYESNKLDEGIDYFTKRLNNCHENVKLDVYMYLFDLIMCRYDDIHRLDEFIEAEKDKELKEILVKEKLTLLNIKNGYEE